MRRRTPGVSRRCLILSATALVTASAWLTAGSALASTVDFNGTRLVAGPGEVNDIVVTRSGDVTTYTDTAGVSIGSGSGCVQNGPNEVDCTSPTLNGLHVYGGDLNDRIALVLPAGSIQLGSEVSGGAGDDTIDASRVEAGTSNFYAGFEGNDTIIGGPMRELFDQSAANDPSAMTIPFTQLLQTVSAGDDHLIGGGGDDIIGALAGADTVDGGTGRDLINTILPSGPSTVADDGAVDNIVCGPDDDQSTAGAGDQIATDCETVNEYLICPSGADCVGGATITAPTGAGSAVASAAAAGKGKQAVLGTSRKTKIRGGGLQAVTIRLRPRSVRKALGKRSQTPAVFSGNLTRVRHGRTVGHVRERVRFKLKR